MAEYFDYDLDIEIGGSVVAHSVSISAEELEEKGWFHQDDLPGMVEAIDTLDERRAAGDTLADAINRALAPHLDQYQQARLAGILRGFQT